AAYTTYRQLKETAPDAVSHAISARDLAAFQDHELLSPHAGPDELIRLTSPLNAEERRRRAELRKEGAAIAASVPTSAALRGSAGDTAPPPMLPENASAVDGLDAWRGDFE